VQELARAAQREGRLEGETAVLQGEKAALQVQHKQFLAWSGQAMVANSVSVMEEAVEQIRTAFLLPQKDLRCDPLAAGQENANTTTLEACPGEPAKGAGVPHGLMAS
jgi:hypothetical protein